MKEYSIWTELEIEFIKNHHLTLSRYDLAKKLNRTISAVNTKIHKLGLTSKFKKSGQYSWTTIYDNISSSAKRRAILFDLSLDDCKNILQKNCMYCNGEPRLYSSYFTRYGKKRYSSATETAISNSWIRVNGIDRIDSNIGYVLSNCVPCCTDCNYAKRSKSVADFLNHIKRIYEFQNIEKDDI